MDRGDWITVMFIATLVLSLASSVAARAFRRAHERRYGPTAGNTLAGSSEGTRPPDPIYFVAQTDPRLERLRHVLLSLVTASVIALAALILLAVTA